MGKSLQVNVPIKLYILQCSGVITQLTFPQVMNESIYWFEYPVETRY
ncbi:unnamed protein product [marine sediment metagenome]|uniref:Uncharacterized protein n=1 Tax=marine sediment metagenome TaxID=412755 RepID=X0RP27_9ZZZZ